jgi:hypothetical protein
MTTIGGNSAQAIYGLAFVPSTGTLYGENAINGKYFSINPATGGETINGLTARFANAMVAVPEPGSLLLGALAGAVLLTVGFIRRTAMRRGG